MAKKLKPQYWQKACKYLAAKDSKLAKIIKNYPGEVLSSKASPFTTLANAIIGQQISVKAAESIWKRFIALMPSLTYKNYLKLKDQALREAGLSRQKIQYLRNIAEYFQKNKITPKYFEKKSREEIADELLAIKGIGKWTLEMFQIFYLLDPDVFPIGDIGLIKAIENNYPNFRRHCEELRRSDVATSQIKDYIVKFSERWAPYRTLVTWYLWRTIDEDPVAY